METRVSAENGRVPVTILHVDGDIDSFTYEALLSQARQLITDGARYMIVDLAKVPYISSAGLRTIYTIFHDLRAVHPEENVSEEQMDKAVRAGTYESPYLKLVNLDTNVKGVFQMGGFDRYIGTYNDLRTAIDSF